MLRNEKVSICSRESINLSLNLYNCGYEECQDKKEKVLNNNENFLLF